MNTIEEQLARFGAGDTMTADDAVRGDVRRARTALRRRRARRVSVGSLAAVGVLAVGSLATSSLVQAPTGSGPVTQAPSSSAGATKLVAYDGPAVAGFDFTEVPEGFRVQAADEGALELARPGVDSDIRSVKDKLAVDLTNLTDLSSRRGRDLQQVTINGLPGVIRGTPGPKAQSATALSFEVPGGRVVDVQAWPGLGLSRAQIIEFAEGITVSDDAVTTLS